MKVGSYVNDEAQTELTIYEGALPQQSLLRLWSPPCLLLPAPTPCCCSILYMPKSLGWRLFDATISCKRQVPTSTRLASL